MRRILLAIGALLLVAPMAYAKGVDQMKREKQERENEVILAFNAGVKAISEKDFDKAIESFTKVIENKNATDDTRAKSYMNRGYSYQRKNDCVKAIADYSESEKIAPQNAELFASRAVCYIDSLKDPAKGLVDIEKAVALDPSKTDYLRIRCVLYFNQKNFAAAMPDCEKVSAASPQDTAILQAVAQGNEVLKNNDKAIAAYKQLLAADPSNTAAQEGLKRLGAAK